MMPDITRLYKGPRHEFEVELVFGGTEDTSPEEAHEFDEYLFVARGSVIITRSDQPDPETVRASGFTHLPAGVTHVIDLQEAMTQLVIIHPDRLPS